MFECLFALIFKLKCVLKTKMKKKKKNFKRLKYLWNAFNILLSRPTMILNVVLLQQLCMQMMLLLLDILIYVCTWQTSRYSG